MFTANPSNGRRDETVISAAWDSVSPSSADRSIPTTSRCVRRTAPFCQRNCRQSRHDRLCRSAHRGAAGTGGPAQASSAQRSRGRRAGRVRDPHRDHFGAPQDIEWARTNGKFWILQARPITALPEVEAAMPTDWTVPEPTAMYVWPASSSSCPTRLAPLFADMIDGAVTRSLQSLFRNPGRGRDQGWRRWPAHGQRVRLLQYSRSGMYRLWKSPPAFGDAVRWGTPRSLAQLLASAIAGSSATGPHATSAS